VTEHLNNPPKSIVRNQLTAPQTERLKKSTTSTWQVFNHVCLKNNTININ